MRLLVPAARSHGQLLAARVQGRLAAALVAAPPFAYPLSAPGLAARVRCVLGQGLPVARRWGCVFRALDALHPREPHWYLGTLGVDPEVQGRGVGSALLAAWLAGADRDGLPAYLETDRERNVGFYARAGFELAGETQVLGVRIWRMWRQARPH
jgi:GNAT superfamily N-acetyltransferase